MRWWLAVVLAACDVAHPAPPADPSIHPLGFGGPTAGDVVVAGGLLRDGRPLANARVELVLMNHWAPSTVTDARGLFTFPPVMTGLYRTVITDADGFETSRFIDVIEPVTVPQVFVIDHPVRVRGSVVDPAGRPVAGAEVSIGCRWQTGPRFYVSDPHGLFEAVLENNHPCDVTAELDGTRLWAELTYAPRPDGPELRIALASAP